jgi:DNA topoisomerase-1
MIIYKKKSDSESDIETDGIDETKVKIPKIKDILKLNKAECIQEYNKPPTRYNEASLINILDPKNLNIGRPSTYATMINTIQNRNYVKISDIKGIPKECLTIKYEKKKFTENIKIVNIGAESNKFMPTDLGMTVNDFLEKNFSTVIDYDFTAKLESTLDKIAEGTKIWHHILQKWYDNFHPHVVELNKLKSEIKIQNKEERLIGQHPELKYDIVITKTKIGYLIKMYETPEKYSSIPFTSRKKLENIKLEDVLSQINYPKLLGTYKKKDIILKNGKYGLYLTYDNKNYSVKKDVNFEEAIELISDSKENYKSIILWTTSDTNSIYSIIDGRYGFYIKVQNIKENKINNYSIKDKEIIDNMDKIVKTMTLPKLLKIIE